MYATSSTVFLELIEVDIYKIAKFGNTESGII